MNQNKDHIFGAKNQILARTFLSLTEDLQG